MKKLEEVVTAMYNGIVGNGQMYGYRWLHLRVLQLCSDPIKSIDLKSAEHRWVWCHQLKVEPMCRRVGLLALGMFQWPDLPAVTQGPRQNDTTRCNFHFMYEFCLFYGNFVQLF